METKHCYGYISGKRAVFVPPSGSEPFADQDSIMKGALYCIPVDGTGEVGD